MVHMNKAELIKSAVKSSELLKNITLPKLIEATSKRWDDTFRSFYYLACKKITTDARHLLIG